MTRLRQMLCDLKSCKPHEKTKHQNAKSIDEN